MSNHLWLLVDANNLAYRMDSVLDLTANGRRIGAVYGVAKALSQWALSHRYAPTTTIFFWDTGHAPERKALLPTYKSKGKDWTQEDRDHYEAFILQCEMLRSLLPHLGVTSIRSTGRKHEADDLIAHYAEMLRDPEEGADRVEIVSGDSDFEQLVGDNIWVFNANNDVIGPEEVLAKRGVPPEQLVYWKAMRGEGSDNVPGIGGIGETRATGLLQAFPELAELKRPAPDPKHKLGKHLQKVLDSWKVYHRNYHLIKLPSEIVEVDRADLEITKGAFDEAAVKRTFMRLGFESLLLKFNTYWNAISGQKGGAYEAEG